MPLAMSEAIVRLLRPSIRLLPQPAQETRLGRSRIGGLPDLPEGTGWPAYPDLGPPEPVPDYEPLVGEPLPFLLQVNLAEVAPFDVEGRLPTSGLLHFFCVDSLRRFGRDLNEEEYVVLYTPPDGARLRRVPAPQGLPFEEMYRGFALTPHLEWTIPRYDDLKEAVEREGILGPPEIDAGLSHWDDLVEEVADLQGLGPWFRPKHRMLGYPDFFQSGGCGPGDWKLLLQVDSDPRYSVPSPDDAPDYPGPGMMWGDAGRIYFGIEQDDLVANNFADVWAIVESH
jgi:uncharacterized protein YwqG